MAKQPTFMNDLLLKQSFVGLLLKGTDEVGRAYYHYIYVRMDKFDEFQTKRLNKEIVDLKDYGLLITSGWGEPDPETQKMVEEKFGFDHDTGLILDDAERYFRNMDEQKRFSHDMFAAEAMRLNDDGE